MDSAVALFLNLRFKSGVAPVHQAFRYSADMHTIPRFLPPGDLFKAQEYPSQLTQITGSTHKLQLS